MNVRVSGTYLASRSCHEICYSNTMIASVSFVLTGNLICNFPQTGKISNFPLLTCMSKHQIPKRIRNNSNHISSSIMVLQTNTMTLGKLVIKCLLKPREDL